MGYVDLMKSRMMSLSTSIFLKPHTPDLKITNH